jgi:hypothetical protein
VGDQLEGRKMKDKVRGRRFVKRQGLSGIKITGVRKT